MLSMLLLFFITTIAQTTKGVVESADVPHPSAHSGNVYALIVGVSNYPYVKPLNFAEEDALLFFEFLRSKAGGEVPENHIKLLLNEQATHANVTAGLAWLNNSLGAQPQDGDRVYIYLSGHGDAYDASEAYYLCYDSNPAGDKNNYQLGGALNIGIMKNRLAAMVKKGVEVILVVDACRSGDVPGVRSGIGNPYQSVIEEPVGEVLLLSAGANQFALEDRRWGGGHGGFTWYLIKGLSGEADSDQDGMVSLIEVESYTKMKVFGDTKQMGAPQTPHFCCDNKFDCVLSKKDEVFSQRIRAEESGNTKVGLTAFAARDALEKAMFEKEELKQAYFALKKACKEQRYLGSNSAWSIWEDCKGKYTAQEIEPIRMYLMGTLAAEGQKAINEEMNVSFENSPKYEYYVSRRQWVDAAITLLKSPDEITGIQEMCDFIKALELNTSVTNAFPYLDSIVYTYQGEMHKAKSIQPYDEADSILKKLEKSFSKSAVYYFMLQSHLQNRQNYYLEDHSQERKKHLQKAMQLAPFWAKPIAMAIVFKLFNKEELEEIINQRKRADPSNADHLYLSFVLKNFHLPIQRQSSLSDLESAFLLRPSTAMLFKFIQERYLNYLLPMEKFLFTEFDQIYQASEKEWQSFEKTMNYYYNSPYHAVECGSDSSSGVRKYINMVTAFAVRCGHPDVAMRWLEKEESVCPSYDTRQCMAILAKYVKKDDGLAKKWDDKARTINTGQEVLLNYYGADKDKIPLPLQGKALYQSAKYFNLALYGRDDWMMEEKKFVDTLGGYGEECFKLAFALRFLSNKHIKNGKSNFENWNDLLDEIRRVDRPDLAPLALSSARFYGILDSITIFLHDDQLSSYLETSPMLKTPVVLLDAAQKNDSNKWNETLSQAYAALGNNQLGLANSLVFSKKNAVYSETPFFKQTFLNPKSQMDRLVLLQMYGAWAMYEEMFQVFKMFDWNHLSAIQPMVLASIVIACSNVEDAKIQEEMMNILIPFAFNSPDQDYSTAISSVQAHFFTRTKIGDELRNKPEYKRIYEKYVQD